MRAAFLMASMAFAALAAACARGDGAPPAAVPVPVVLVTGFEPFAGADVNASWEAVRVLEGRTVAGHRVVLARLPVVYDAVEKPLLDAIETHRPRVVVCFGQGHPVVRVERTARNAYDPRLVADEAGRPPPRSEIVPGGAATLPTALPADAILAALAREGIHAEASDDAGGFLCNECFYRLMRPTAAGSAGALVRVERRGFVHVPAIGAEDASGPPWTLERIRRAVEVVVETACASDG